MVVHACNLRCSGVNWENHCLRPAWATSETHITTNKLDLVAHACNTNYVGGLWSKTSPRQKYKTLPCLKNNKDRKGCGVTQVLECHAGKHEAECKSQTLLHKMKL
jgi:hypothetical protein